MHYVASFKADILSSAKSLAQPRKTGTENRSLGRKASVADPEGDQGVRLNPRPFPPVFKYPMKMK